MKLCLLGSCVFLAHVTSMAANPTAADLIGSAAMMAQPPNPPSPVPLMSVVSRKSHGLDAGFFDIDLQSATNVECRASGPDGRHSVLFRFANPLESVGGAGVTGGGLVAHSAIGADPRDYIVTLTNIADAQIVRITLSYVTDAAGNHSITVSSGMTVLFGDTNSDGAVNVADALQCRSGAGQTVDASNFRSDVNLDRVINSGDAAIIRSQAGSGVGAAYPAE